MWNAKVRFFHILSMFLLVEEAYSSPCIINSSAPHRAKLLK